MALAVIENEPPAPGYLSDEERWTALTQRDGKADGVFYYSVESTGVYCRPSCGARMPKRDNVRFHGTREAAEKAGFRPCKRCRPDQPALAERRAAAIEKACRTLADADELPNLDELAAACAMSRFHFQRVFKSIAGVTPRAYFAQNRVRRVRHEITQHGTITQAIYDAGFNSNGRFYATSNEFLGMTPTTYRAGGAGERIRFAVGECSLGAILVAATEKGICSILFGDDPNTLVHDLERRFPKADLAGGDTDFEQWVAKVVGLIETPNQRFSLPLDMRGTAFQVRVWQALRQIPPGSTATYSEIAERIGVPKAVRAVARACASNWLAVAIPCHRVVRNDGALSGYRWGVDRKRVLLDREARA